MSVRYANKMLERLTRKGRLTRYAHGRYELVEKPLSAFDSIVALEPILHRSVSDVGGVAVGVGPRVHGLGFTLRLGVAGQRKHVELEKGKA